MAIYPDLLEIVGKEQEIKQSQTLNDFRNIQIEQARRNMAMQDSTRQIVRDAQLAADQADNQNRPTTPQTAADGTTPPPPDPVVQAQTAAMRIATRYDAEAAALRRSGTADPAAIKEAELRAEQAQTALWHATTSVFEQQKEKSKRLASYAGAVMPDGSNVKGVVDKIDEIVPGWSKHADLDKDLMGNVTWGAHTQAALATTQKMGQTANEQATVDQQKARLAFEKQQEANRQLRETRLETESRRRDALARDGLDLKEREFKARQDRADPALKNTPIREADIKDEAARIKQDNPTLTEPDSKAAARDYLSKINELMRNNAARVKAGDYTREDAQLEAQNFINTKIETGSPGKPYVSHWFSADEPGRDASKGKYNRSKQGGGDMGPVDMPAEAAAALGRTGAKFSLDASTGVVTFPDAATANKGIAALPEGATFIGPDGKTYKKKAK